MNKKPSNGQKKNFERPSDILLLKSHLKTLLEILAP